MFVSEVQSDCVDRGDEIDGRVDGDHGTRAGLELENRENSCKTIFATGTCGVFRIKRGPLDTVGIGFVGGKIHLALQKLEKQPSFFISPKRLLVPTPPRLCTVQFNSRPVAYYPNATAGAW